MEDQRNAPIILWHQGGPSAPSMYGLLFMTGPIRILENKIERREITWSSKAHIIYVDNPVGTGFSFTEDDRGYARNQEDVGRDMLEFLNQFFTLFPHLQRNDFYVFGESYGGKYAPGVAYAIHKSDSSKINLKGVIVANGWTDPINQLVYGDFLFHIGLVDGGARNDLQILELSCKNLIRDKRLSDARLCWNSLIGMFMEIIGFPHLFNFIDTSVDNSDVEINEFFRRPDIRDAIHVGNNEFTDISSNGKVSQSLNEDFMDSIVDRLDVLLDHYKVFYYTGQLDIVVPYIGTDKFLQNLKFSSAMELENSKRHQWKVGNELAGYVRTAGNLTQIMVRNAGHDVPIDQPEWALDLITRILLNKPF